MTTLKLTFLHEMSIITFANLDFIENQKFTLYINQSVIAHEND